MSQIDTALFTSEQKLAFLAALEAAIFRGVDYVSYGGDQIKYRSLLEMIAIRDMLRVELGMPVAKRRVKSRRLIVRMSR